jgi:hypothetical protein
VAHHKDGALARDRLQLVEGGQDEDRGLSETGLGLAENIDVEDCGGNAVLLDCGEAERWLDLVSTQGEAAKKEQSCRRVYVRSSVHLAKPSHQNYNTTDTQTYNPQSLLSSFHGAINHTKGSREAVMTENGCARNLHLQTT